MSAVRDNAIQSTKDSGAPICHEWKPEGAGTPITDLESLLPELGARKALDDVDVFLTPGCLTTARLAFSRMPWRLAALFTANSIAGGSIDTEITEEAAMPCGSPCSSNVVTTDTEVAYWRMTLRNAA